MRGVVDDPREAWVRARGAPFLFEVPAAQIRALGFAGSDPDNPFVVTLRDYAAGRCSAYQGSALEDFYRQWQPFRTAHDAPAGQPEPPWRESRRRAENTAAGRLQRAGFLEIARELGVRPEDIRGHITGGPVTGAFGEVTFRRLARLYDSVRRDGFRPDQSDASYPSGTCHLRGDDFRVHGRKRQTPCDGLARLGLVEDPCRAGAPQGARGHASRGGRRLAQCPLGSLHSGRSIASLRRQLRGWPSLGLVCRARRHPVTRGCGAGHDGVAFSLAGGRRPLRGCPVQRKVRTPRGSTPRASAGPADASPPPRTVSQKIYRPPRRVRLKRRGKSPPRDE